ncbi:MAG: G/T mismatches repair enzyme [Methanomassiliicoccales archaeon PtaU1.Bin124]|nr:MAG: G/T mismatches repair enzyme [Methanomassiliicoccales archaeon PtaU1.Bin124]
MVDENEIRLVLLGIKENIAGEAFPGADDLEMPEWPRDPFHVLIATVLSQRTKDANTYKASKQLFAALPDVRAIADAEETEIEALIRPSGFYKVKAKGIKGLCQQIIDRFGGKVPDDIDDLVSLPMVGRKTANCVLSYGFEVDAVCVDTHVHRISNRLGWVSTDDADETETALRRIAPKDKWSEINRLMVRFGQKTCLPRNPRCGQCPVSSRCNYFEKLKKA